MKEVTFAQQALISQVPLPGWIRAAARCGFAVAPVLDEIGIPLVDTGEHGIVITQAQSFRLMEMCTARAKAKAEHFPFVFGEHCGLESVPEIQTYVCTCATLRDAIASYNWVRDLMNNGVNLSLHETEHYATIRIDFGDAPARAGASIFFTETLVTSVVKLITQLAGRKEVERVLFRHAPPDYFPLYTRFFGLPVQFDQEADAVMIRSELLNRPLNGAVPALHQQAKAQILHRVAKLHALGSITAQLSRLFADRPELLMQGLDAAATALHIHPRTLQRRLHEEHQSFADVQAQSRFQKTCCLLRHTDCSVNEISDRLGFSDRRAFTRAFKRWSKVSPSDYRALR